MTAMVDVAFLLLTFFVLTATMTDAFLMKFVSGPKEEHPHLPVAEERVLTVILEADDQIQYYIGQYEGELAETHYGQTGLRKVLHEHLTAQAPLCDPASREIKGCWDPLFVIKPTARARYKNMVDMLDELAMAGAQRYVLQSFTSADSLAMLAAH